MNSAIVLLILLILFVVVPWPFYLIGKKRAVSYPWVAFIPLVGSTIVWLWAMERSGWMTLISFVPIVNIIFGIWLCFAMPLITTGRAGGESRSSFFPGSARSGMR